MSSADSEQEFWARLRAYFETLHALEYLPTDHDEARAMGVKHSYLYRSDGTRPRPRMLEYPPATKEQLQATEEQLGFPLPADLRSLYSIVANGGFDLGPVEVFHGAIGGCGEFANYEPGGRTIEDLVSHSGWRFHPRMEEALLRNPGYYVIVDSSPEGFLEIGADHPYSIMLDPQTGHVYHFEYWGEIPNAPDDGALPVNLFSIDVVAPSLAVWIEHWLDQSLWQPYGGHLLTEMVETDDLPDPDDVWRGLYRFGPNWSPRSDDAEDDDSPSRYPLDG